VALLEIARHELAGLELGTGQETGPIFADISAISPLGEPSVWAATNAWGLIVADGPLSPSSLLVRHDFSQQVKGLTTSYQMVMVTPSGLVRAPISSWQATLQTEAQNFLQAVVPSCGPYLTGINAATDFYILRRVTLPDGFVFEYQMASSSVSFVSVAQGPNNYTATISGYSPPFPTNTDPPAIFDRTLEGVRSVFMQSSGIRVRCDMDWLLQPGQRAFYGESPFIVSYINYYALDGQQYADVGERIETP
jgi:hypothetical protein